MKIGLRPLIAIISLGFIFINFTFSQGAENSSRAQIKYQSWRYMKDIRISGDPKAGDLVKVTLDQDIFNHAQEDLRDIRIDGSDGAEVPYKLIVEKSFYSQNNIYPVRILNNSFSSDGQYNIFIVDFEQKGFLNSSLNILISSDNFKRTVEVSGSNDMQSWNVLKTNGYIYNYTDRIANFRAGDTEVSYPENTYQYLQVKIFSRGEAPLAISGAQVSRIVNSSNKEMTIQPKYRIEENSARKTTDIVIDLEKKGWPTSNMLIDSGTDNFNREVVIYESDDKASWRQLGNGYIFNLNTPKFTGANLNIDYSESRTRYLKAEIFNGDDTPITVRGISIKTILRSMVFQYKEGVSYALYYQNPAASFPQYDLERFFSYLDTDNYFSTVLSGEKHNPYFPFDDQPPQLSLAERIPYLLEMVLVLTIFVMGYFVFRFMKKVGSVT